MYLMCDQDNSSSSSVSQIHQKVGHPWSWKALAHSQTAYTGGPKQASERPSLLLSEKPTEIREIH